MPFEKKNKEQQGSIMSESTPLTEGDATHVTTAPAIKKDIQNKKTRTNKPVVFNSTQQKGRSSVVYIKATDKVPVWNGEKYVVKQIRYVAGESSIYVEDQNEKAEAGVIEMKAGKIICDPLFEANKLEYLRATNQNKGNPSRDASSEALFYEHNPEAEARAQMERTEVKDSAIVLYKQCAFDDIVVIAKNLAEYSNAIRTMEPSELRFAIRNYVEREPDEFLKLMADPRKDVRAILFDAIELQVVKSERQGIVWPDGRRIAEIPVGVEAIDFLADWIVGGGGSSEYAEIKKRVEAKK